MQQGSNEYSSQYYHPHHYPSSLPNANPNPNPSPHPNPNPNPSEFPPSNPIQSSFASAPPYSNYSTPEFPTYSAPYPSYSPNPDPVPASAPSQFQSQSQSQFPQFQHYNSSSPLPPPFAQEQQTPSYPHLQQPYYPYDSNQSPAPYPTPSNPNINPSPYPSPYENLPVFDQDSGYSAYGHGLYEKKLPEKSRFGEDGKGDGVYAYDGGSVEPYGARGTGGSRSSSSSLAKFDDYGRSLSLGGGGKDQPQAKIVRAVPKMESQQDVKNGVQKFRVKLLPEGGSITATDVLCQIGLDGIRMLDTSTSRTLRIYPLENVTRWEVLDSSIFAFWSKSPVDFEPRRIRLQSNSYTTNTILDTVTAATVQLKEMGGKDSLNGRQASADSGKPAEQTTEKKKGLVDWMNLIKPGNEEKDHWVPDEAVSKCTSCEADFGAFLRKHHCRNCGDIFCDKCTQGRIALTADEQAQPVRVCDRCMGEVSHRLSSAKEIAIKSTGVHSHEDLARKLQEEMERNRKSSSGSNSASNGSGRKMREVACPICTVHLQVQVPSSGSETIECGVCQHPFLVSAH